MLLKVGTVQTSFRHLGSTLSCVDFLLLLSCFTKTTSHEQSFLFQVFFHPVVDDVWFKLHLINFVFGKTISELY